jgi:hypothetical protein
MKWIKRMIMSMSSKQKRFNLVKMNGPCVQEKNKIIHEASGLCMDVAGQSNNGHVQLKPCKDNADSQIWTFEHYLQ